MTCKFLNCHFSQYKRGQINILDTVKVKKNKFNYQVFYILKKFKYKIKKIKKMQKRVPKKL